jgi:hypothetical protein
MVESNLLMACVRLPASQRAVHNKCFVSMLGEVDELMAWLNQHDGQEALIRSLRMAKARAVNEYLKSKQRNAPDSNRGKHRE